MQIVRRLFQHIPLRGTELIVGRFIPVLLSSGRVISQAKFLDFGLPIMARRYGDAVHEPENPPWPVPPNPPRATLADDLPAPKRPPPPPPPPMLEGMNGRLEKISLTKGCAL